MKNKFLKMALVFMFAFCSLAMFACGEGGDLTMSYKDLPEFVTEMRNNTALFEIGTVDGVSTNFVIKELNSSENRYFNECLIIPINYIAKYQSDIEVIATKGGLNGEQNASISNLETSMAEMKLAYQDMCSEYEILTTFSAEDEIIYKGVLQQFKYSVTRFISSAYEVAIKFADVQNKVLDRFEGMVTRVITTADTEVLRDYTTLMVGQDYANILLVSTNSKDFTTSAYNNDYSEMLKSVKANYSAYIASYCGAKNFNNIASAPIEAGYNNALVSKVLDFEKVMNEEREMVKSSLSKFSMYDLFQKYNCNVTAYENDVEYATYYIEEISLYYSTLLVEHVNYLRTILIG